MPTIATSEQADREKLKGLRNLLFENFLKNPDDIRLAVEIKRIDDQIAEYSTVRTLVDAS